MRNLYIAIGIFLVSTLAISAGRLQNRDFASGSDITGAGGVLSQLLNTSKIWDSANAQLLDTTIASKITNPMTTAEDLIKGGASGTPTRLGVGTNGQCLTVTGGALVWGACGSASPLTTKGDLYTYDTGNVRLPVGADGLFLKANSATATGLEWAAAGGGSGDSVAKAITQTTHGFAIGDVIYYSGSAWAKAKADVDATSEVLGVVSVVPGANDFTVTQLGYISGLSGLSAGTTYYLSAATAGALTATEPCSIASQVSKPVLVAVSATTAYIIHSRGAVCASQSSGVLGEWAAYTPSLGSGFGTATAVTFQYKVVGDTLKIRGALTTGTVAGSLSTISLPGSYAISSSKSVKANTDVQSGPSVGKIQWAAANQYVNLVSAVGTSSAQVYVANAISVGGNLTPTFGTTSLASSTEMFIEFEVPID